MASIKNILFSSMAIHPRSLAWRIKQKEPGHSFGRRDKFANAISGGTQPYPFEGGRSVGNLQFPTIATRWQSGEQRWLQYGWKRGVKEKGRGLGFQGCSTEAPSGPGLAEGKVKGIRSSQAERST